MIGDIARALGVEPGSVVVSRWTQNRRRTAAHLFGQCEGKTFFAKVLLRESYPLMAPIAFPDQDLSRRRQIAQSGENQIQTEWQVAQRFSAVSGAAAIPKAIARSSNTIVWELLPGMPLDSMIKQVWSAGTRERGGSKALRDAGAWLKQLHESSSGAPVSLDLVDSITALVRYRQTLPQALHRHIDTALNFLELAVTRLKADRVSVPRSFTHGDFSLPNMLWHPATRRLAIVDFEHACERASVHDLIVLLCNLRVKFLNPMVSSSVVNRLEASFWEGYGKIAPELEILVNSLTSAWIFYHFIPKISQELKHQGWMQRIWITAYEKCFQEKLAAGVSRRFRSQLQSIVH
jgi:thiamine kinase-like enzyme